ncbi:3-hydroxyisobutyryl-CoA hydrolase, mitochondrial [Diorhabda carinulata]|uniref:3-hydroxyisobutyryl-CoA hydrolase, mitochondrial n=1 Tax=Diorhabda carinulata TaxID=1163345 RepID=UPI0025A0F722|nr:3-hydroxyisobutyryl-CoA hydrolase, mitochondrial [Diorhabda carinulata]
MIRQYIPLLFKNKNLFVSFNRNMSVQVNDVILEDVQNKGVITLNRPKALNALNLSMIEKVQAALKEWENKKCLVLVKGSGEKAFCAGGDVRAVAEAGLKGEKSLGEEFFKKEYATNNLIGAYKIPYIAFIDGIVMGGGVGLSVHGRYRIVTERTLFAMPETQIGFFPDVGGSYFLPRLAGKLGLYLGLTGQRLRGSDVVKAGIGTHFCESKDLKDLEQALLDDCASDTDIQNVLLKFCKTNLPPFSLESNINKINDYFAASTVEGIVTKLEKDDSKWAQDTLSLLRKMSPTSLKVTFKQIDLGQHYNLSECLQMEYNMCMSFLKNKDFYEGVRALLIDKDQCPNWSPKKLEDVSEAAVDKYFSNLPKLKIKM